MPFGPLADSQKRGYESELYGWYTGGAGAGQHNHFHQDRDFDWQVTVARIIESIQSLAPQDPLCRRAKLGDERVVFLPSSTPARATYWDTLAFITDAELLVLDITLGLKIFSVAVRGFQQFSGLFDLRHAGAIQ